MYIVFKITKQLIYQNESGMHIQLEQDSAICEIVNLSIKLSTFNYEQFRERDLRIILTFIRPTFWFQLKVIQSQSCSWFDLTFG